LDEARRRGFNPHAIEFNHTQIRHIRDVLRIPCVAKPLSDDPFSGKSFDVIYHCDVVSHFYDPFAEFRAFHHALKDEGLLVFETGNLGDTDHRYLRLFDRFQYPDHLFFFSSDNIAQLLSSTGFELVRIYRYSLVTDLWVGRLRTRARKFFRRLGSGDHNANQSAHVSFDGPQTQTAAGRGVLHTIKRVDQYIAYLLRYRFGRLLPKGTRPQTMIVVARKSGPPVARQRGAENE
ncbi:MAG: class I SAM-dependent methyltransferase, partial [Planctomycetales bacterium]|nr:class I SAM-dependent methyltransferase [Planctomycetales bacterium]